MKTLRIGIAASCLVAAVLFANTGCGDAGEAFVKDMCACKDDACTKDVMKKHEATFPELKTNLKEIDKLDEKKKDQIKRAMECRKEAMIAGDKK
jgi:hypothetical protein